MKQFRTIRIIKLMTSVVTSVLRGDKLVLDQNSAKLEELGGIYIKFLQLVVLNLDPNNQSSYKQLLNVYENSQPDPITIRTYLSRELSTDSWDMFKTIEEQPFATGSFGQVYKAQLWNDKPVIIKVLRPSVIRYLNYDLRLMGFLSWIYSVFDRQKMLNFRDIFKDFKRTCLDETNYIREATVARSYYEDYKNHPYLVIPQTYLQLCSYKVITQDYVQGLSLTSLLEMHSGGVDPVTKPYFNQLIEHRMFMKALFFGINKGNRFGFSFDLNATSLWKAIQTYFVLIGRFDNNGDNRSVQVVLEMLNEIIWFAENNLAKIIESLKTEINPTEVLETLSCWFDKMARNDPWLMSRLVSGYIE